MRTHFDKSSEIDAASRSSLVTMIGTHEEVYTPAEEKIITDGVAMFGLFEGLGVKDIAMVSPLTRAKIHFEAGDNHAFGWATTSVRARCVKPFALLKCSPHI